MRRRSQLSENSLAADTSHRTAASTHIAANPRTCAFILPPIHAYCVCWYRADAIASFRFVHHLAMEQGHLAFQFLDPGGGHRIEVAVPDGNVCFFSRLERADPILEK